MDITKNNNVLKKPELPQKSSNGIIDVSKMKNDFLLVIINHFDTEKPNEKICVFVGDIKSGPYFIEHYPPPYNIPITIPFSEIPDGDYKVTYTVTDVANCASSEPAYVKIINSSSIKNKVESISLQPKNSTVVVGSSVMLTATVKETGGITQEGIEVFFSAENNSVTFNPPSITTNGKGQATTQVTSNQVVATTVVASMESGGRVAFADITFVPYIITITPHNITVGNGDSVTFVVVVQDSDGNYCGDVGVAFDINSPRYADTLTYANPPSGKTQYDGSFSTVVQFSDVEAIYTPMRVPVDITVKVTSPKGDVQYAYPDITIFVPADRGAPLR